MKRREFLRTAAAAAASLPILINKTHAASLSGFKNIVVIVSDDHTSKTLGVNGNSMIQTPHMDRMASQGVHFTHAYCNAPICSASRQSLLTGKYPHATGVNLLFTPFPDKNNVTLAEHLQEHGYFTGRIGKTHFNNWIYAGFYKEDAGYPNHGFDYAVTRQDHKEYLKTNPPKPVPDDIPTYQSEAPHETPASRWNAGYLPDHHYCEDAEGTFFTNKAIEFMRGHRDTDSPFFLWLAYHEPHMPFSFPIEYRNRYNPDDIPLPQGSPEDNRWIPELFADLSEQEKKRIIASYYTSVEYMDHNIGRVVEALREMGLDENTVVVYASDNGYLLADHKRFEKHSMWEESVRVPFMMQGNGFQSGANDCLVEFIDMAPTLCDLVGVTPHPDFQGQSLRPVLYGETDEHREYVFSEYLEDNKAMVASQKWKYIFTTGKRDLSLGYETGKGPSGVDERLYHLKRDPGETHNVADEPENQAILESLRQVMLQRFMQTHPDAKDVPEHLNTLGRLIWFCEPRDVGDEPGLPLERIFRDE